METELVLSPIRPISVREYIENRLQPPFPFPFHGKHDGEPSYPRALKKTLGSAELVEAGREGVIWHKWAQTQPDFTLLSYERDLFDRLQREQVRLSNKELDEIKSKWIEKANTLRKSGLGSFVVKYWPHLISSESSG